jgi:hypothetical protein
MTSKPNSLQSLGLSGWNYWMKLGETLQATGTVLSQRGKIIDHAIRNPLKSDTRELARMIPEKMTALSRSGESLADDMAQMQKLSVAHIGDLLAVSLRGRLPTLEDFERLTSRVLQIGSLAANAWLGALTPIHQTVTANAKRLG